MPSTIPGIDIDEKNIVSSTGALEFEKVPKKLAVIGGGYIGLELGSVWKRLGADVTVIEFSDTLVPTMDKDIAKIFHSTLTKQGINFMLSTKVEGALNKKEKVQINCLNLLNNKSEILDFDKVLLHPNIIVTAFYCILIPFYCI